MTKTFMGHRKTKETKPDWRSRLVCFTCFDTKRDLRELANSVQYLAYGLEKCPTTSREHFQAFAYSATPQRFSWWQKLLKPMHFEPCHGTLDQNQTYCSKAGQYTEIGMKPMGSGNKRILLEIKDQLDKGEPLRKLRKIDGAFDAVLRHERGLKEYERQLRMDKMYADGYKSKQVIVITGPTNTGKSRTIYDRHVATDVYSMPNCTGQWAGTYDGQPVVLYDDVGRGNIMPITDFLRLCDGYPIEVPVKGGFVPWTPTSIYFTSNFKFDEWWPYADPEHIAAARRRVTEWIEKT